MTLKIDQIWRTYWYFPETQVFQSELSMDEIHNMDQLELWERTAKEILSSLSNEDDKSSTTSKHKFKYLAIHSATRYEYKESNSKEEAANMSSQLLS